MPTYSYECTTCTHKWDEVRPVAERNKPRDGCPVCTNDYVIRVLTPTPTIFKGRGFYKTDNRKN